METLGIAHEAPPGMEIDELREACGVFGIYQPGADDLAQQVFKGLLELQHRGQDAAGIAIFGDEGPIAEHNLGHVEDAIPNCGATLDGMLINPRCAIGHVRYGTVVAENAYDTIQPMLDPETHSFALSHNGHIANIEEVAETFGLTKDEYQTDSHAMTIILSRLTKEHSLDYALDTLLPLLEGAYSLVISDGKRLIGVRDPNGFRPLCIGEIQDAERPGFILSSEDAALRTSRASYLRDINPGEIVIIDDQGVQSRQIDKEINPKTCAFEWVYFARPDSRIDGQSVYSARRRSGELLAEEDSKLDADVVIGVPDTGLYAATGYARVSELPLEIGFFKNPYTGRTFITPGPMTRAEAVRLKLRPNPEVVKGKRVVVVDDSIVRGTTTREIVKMLYEAEATEVHVRIPSPPYMWPCFYGMDTGNPEELLAAYKTIEEMRETIGATSLGFLSPEGLERAIGLEIGRLCMACSDGNYPTPLPPYAIPVSLLNRKST